MKTPIALEVSLNTLLVVGLALFLFSLGCFAAGEEARARAGNGASVEGGVSIGQTGINSGGVAGSLGHGIDINRAPPGTIKLRLPPNRRDREERASTGASRAESQATDLGADAEREEDAIRRKARSGSAR